MPCQDLCQQDSYHLKTVLTHKTVTLNTWNRQSSKPILGLVTNLYKRNHKQISPQDVCHPKTFHHVKFVMNRKLPTWATPTTDNSDSQNSQHAIPTHDNSRQFLPRTRTVLVFRWELPYELHSFLFPQDSIHRTIYHSIILHRFCSKFTPHIV